MKAMKYLKKLLIKNRNTITEAICQKQLKKKIISKIEQWALVSGRNMNEQIKWFLIGKREGIKSRMKIPKKIITELDK